MKDSILSNEPVCFVCGTTNDLHHHHIFHGIANRKISDREGCWVYLCGYHHNLSQEGVHFNMPFEITLKKYCQERWEKLHGDKAREKFMQLFGKSYL